MKYFFLIILMILSYPSFASLVVEKKCGAYTMELHSQGKYYDDHIILEKIDKSGGYDGFWKMISYKQKFKFLGPSPINMNKVEHIDLGHGMWMNTKITFTPNAGYSEMIDGHVMWEVKNGKIGYSETNVWIGTLDASGKATITWPGVPNMAANPLYGQARLDDGQNTIKIEIFNPSENEIFAFDGSNPGQFFVDTIAKVTPQQYESQLKWETDKIQGTNISVSGQGGQVRITYKKLPADNSQFGPHQITAKLDADSCQLEAKIPIKVFYLRNEKNNPDGSVPNWFYYWKQTPAAKPKGQIVNIEYGGYTYKHCSNLSTAALFDPHGPHKTLFVCDLNRFGDRFKNRFPILSRPMSGTATFNTSYDIDTYATVLLHEFVHYTVYSNYWYGKSNAYILQNDKDKDGILDSAEPGLQFDPTKTQTYMSTHAELKNITYDEEWLAYEAMKDYALGTYNNLDWSVPGAQWPTP